MQHIFEVNIVSSISQNKMENLFPVQLLQSGHHVFPDSPLAVVMLAVDAFDEISADEGFLDIWLAPSEQQRFASFKLPKRQKEWLAGRICTKIAVQKFHSQLSHIPSDRVTVVNDENGRPALFLDDSSFPSLETSLSHSGEFALALVAENYCGVDIQESRDTLLRVKERFCTESDERVLATAFANTPGLIELNLLWTVKEAIRKTMSYQHIPDFLKINLDRVGQLNHDTFAFHCHYQHNLMTAVCGHYKSYGLAFCISPG